MKQINNGFSDCYYLTKEGNVYNNKTQRYIKYSDKHRVRLKLENNKYKEISQKKLYKLVYNDVFCEDDIQDLEGEEWRVVENTDNTYYVSNKGRIKSKTKYKAMILKPTLNKSGYERVDIYIEKQRQTMLVHRLVAAAFLMPPKSIEMVIHHKDMDIHNNNANNLEWLTKSEHRKIHAKLKSNNNETKDNENITKE